MKKPNNPNNYMNVYQYSDGTFLTSSSQPESEENNEITSDLYTPHKSTRYKNVIIGNNGYAQEMIEGELQDTERVLPELYFRREDCCGCFACYSICPTHAIEMCPDEEGFLFPVVDAYKCIRCYNCINTCDFK